ncbi:NAD-dependent epimerase/dehydratase family protein [Limnospira fusiformis KN01]|uniref:NAD-dependent epimerase/dehydratase family protein n=1 Tax=Limnospira fusiformis TaxID=54297 RepID=UPI00165877FD|nr:NAD-dependent epimerase/dehydratase family protein [Limnospira fusiformis]MDY7053861.1 NAD-dependent epimerase/dehydratase family protein [Limnospira fusiformis LS22]ULB45248.1 NAD-dependent epimerase/dehydratase family protein [Limnospira fusiformis KN01]
MTIVLITGSAGLIGSEAVSFFIEKGYTVVGIDNNMRQTLFGEEASTEWNLNRLLSIYQDQYIHCQADIRDRHHIDQIFKSYGEDISLIIHTAGQPSHDWAAQDPETDFTINANGTLVLLEATRQHCPNAVFIHCSTNKVYGDSPNILPLVEQELRWEIEPDHIYANGIDETMSIDQSKHSLFGVSKAAADLLVQEYGRYFGMKTAAFRGGCLTGPTHSGTQLHGFLSYLIKCTMMGTPYQVFGYKGKQVRDNIHSYDLINAFYHFYLSPRIGEVYNMGGSRHSNCSMLEAIQHCESIVEKKLNWTYSESNRIGDHIWWISDVSKFKKHYPDWHFTYTVPDILKEMFVKNTERWV